MFKCCVCQSKTSRRTSTEEEDDSEKSSSTSSSSSSSEEEEDEEERQIEEELAKKFKCQTPNTREPVVAVGGMLKEVKEENEEDEEDEDEDETETETESSGKVVVEVVNGEVTSLREEINQKAVDRDAVKEDVAEILCNAVKIVQEIKKSEWERLENIKEEVAEETAVEESNNATTVTGAGEPAVDHQIDVANKDSACKPGLEKVESDETEEEVVTVIEEQEDEEGGEYEIIEDVKREEPILEICKTHQIEEKIIEELIDALNEEADNDQELKEIAATGEQQPEETSNEEAPATSVHPPETNGTSQSAETSNEPTPAISPRPDESSTSSAESPLPPPYREVEIVEERKKSDYTRIENGISRCSVEKFQIDQEAIELTVKREASSSQGEVVEVTVKQSIYPSEGQVIGETIAEGGAFNGDLLNIPPPAMSPPLAEETSGSRSSDLDFPTPPPIDFDVSAETDQESEPDEPPPPSKEPPVPPPWDEETTPPPLTLPMLNRQLSASPGSKSLPSPPSPGSETGCETEADSKSSSDEQQTAKMAPVPCLSRNAYTERTIDDVPDEEGDDSVFESASLAKDTEEAAPPLEDIPPRPVPPVPRWLSQEEDEGNGSNGSEILGGMQEPPATPVARDELALRRHRFFSDLLQAARSTAEHRVSFDPLGPMVHPGYEHDDREEHLEELVNRLENVTKRLEQVSVIPAPVQTHEIAVQTKSPSPERSLSLNEESSSESSRSTTVSGASVVEVVKNMSINAYEDLLAGPVHEYIQLSQKIGGDVAAHSKLVEKAFQIQLQFLKTAASRPTPSNQSEQVSLLGPTSTQIQAIQDFREKNRGSGFFNHLSAISESIPALGWVAVAPTPAPYVKEMNDAGQFYTNRVLKDWKEKDKTHVDWCKAWVKTLTDLQQFVRQNHTTGLVWAKAGSVPAGGVPPPPPPCMMPMADPAPVVNDDRSALFAEINQGENITKNLKKVTSDMQTHKNPSLRTGPAPFKAPVVSNSGSPANVPIDKPPVFTRDGKKWLVEYHKGNKNLVIDNVEMNNVVYMYRSQDSNLVVKGKVNSVVIDSCRKCAVVFDSVVASIEFVNCQSVQMQVLGKVPTISIDKTDGCQMYLNNDTLNVELITSKSSEMNILVPVGNGDYTEHPIPEQFKTVITEKGLRTVAVDSLG